MHPQYTTPHNNTDTPGPRTPPKPDFGPAEVLIALDILSRRQAARNSRLSSFTRLRGV